MTAPFPRGNQAGNRANGPALMPSIGNDMQGVLIAIGGVLLAAMFLILYARAKVAETRNAALEKELEILRRKPGA